MYKTIFSKTIGVALVMTSIITNLSNLIELQAVELTSISSSSISSSSTDSSSSSNNSISSSQISSISSGTNLSSSSLSSSTSSDEIIPVDTKIPDPIKLDSKTEEKIKSCISKKSNSQNEITIVNVTEVNGRLAKENIDSNIFIGVAYLNKAKKNKKLLDTITYTFKIIDDKVKCSKQQISEDLKPKVLTEVEIKEGQKRWKEFNENLQKYKEQDKQQLKIPSNYTPRTREYEKELTQMGFFESIFGNIKAQAVGLDCTINLPSIYAHEERIINKAKAYGITNKNQVAYMLATSYHETCFFTNFIEYGGDTPQAAYNYYELLYGYDKPKGVELGNTQIGDGAKYAGRGYVHLTGKSNYQSYKTITGRDLINNPELAETDKELAAFIMIDGMSNGIFTTAKIGSFINNTTTDFYNARTVVNGIDKAALIEGYARNLYLTDDRIKNYNVNPITDPNINSVQPIQADYMIALDEGCKTNEGSPVFMYSRNNGDCQKMRYNASNSTITNPFGKCLDAGDVSSSTNNWIRFASCHNGNNQKWMQDSNGRIWSFQKNSSNQTVCIEYNGTANNSSVAVKTCNNNQSQKFHFDLGITRASVPDTTLVDPNITSVQPIQEAYWKTLDNYCNINDGSNVYILDRTESNCQKIRFNSGNGTMTNPYGKCLDAGNSNSAGALVFYSCNNTNNQKWRQDNGGRIWSVQKNNSNQTVCMEYYGTGNGSPVIVRPCNGNQGQKFYFDLNITRQEVPAAASTYNKYLFRRTGTSQCINMYSPYNGSKVDTWTCNTGDNDQIFEAIPGQNGSYAYRKIGTNFCIDAWNPSNNTSVYAWPCDYNASNHNWYYNWSTKMFQERNTSQCLARYQPTNGTQLVTWNCNNSDGNLMWDAIQV